MSGSTGCTTRPTRTRSCSASWCPASSEIFSAPQPFDILKDMSRESNPVDQVLADLRETGYLADVATGTVVHLGAVLEKPVLIEGPAGTGKTSLAKSEASATGKQLIRLQCY